MKKIGFKLTLLILLTSQICLSQSREELPEIFKNTSTTTFSFNIGPAIPIGEFGEIDINNEKAGLAKTGIQLMGNLNFLISESFYLSLQGGFSSNAINEDELLIPTRNNVPSFVNVSATSSKWKAFSLNVGAGTKTAIDSRTFFLTKFGIGLHNLSSPRFQITLSDGSTTQIINQSSSSANNINLNLGALIETEVNETTLFRIGLDYFKAVQNFEDIEIRSVVNGMTNVPTEVFGFSQNFETISITVGLAFRI